MQPVAMSRQKHHADATDACDPFTPPTSPRAAGERSCADLRKLSASCTERSREKLREKWLDSGKRMNLMTDVACRKAEEVRADVAEALRRHGLRKQSERDAKEFRACSWAIINCISCCFLLAYYTGGVGVLTAIRLEAVLALGKAALEVYWGDLGLQLRPPKVVGADLWAHHSLMVAAVYLSHTPGFAPLRFLTVRVQTIHLPLGLLNASKGCKSWWPDMSRQLDVAYLCTWPLVAWRCLSIVYHGSAAVAAGSWASGVVLLGLASLLMWIDWSWTPWYKYQRELKHWVSPY
eukprot:COSAG02_NODE_4833_length_4924_cov_14.701175_2_plen_292_part_00